MHWDTHTHCLLHLYMYPTLPDLLFIRWLYDAVINLAAKWFERSDSVLLHTSPTPPLPHYDLISGDSMCCHVMINVYIFDLSGMAKQMMV